MPTRFRVVEGRNYSALPRCGCSLLIHHQGRTLYVLLSDFLYFCFSFPSCTSITTSFLVVMFLKQWLYPPPLLYCLSVLVGLASYLPITVVIFLLQYIYGNSLTFFNLAHSQDLYKYFLFSSSVHQI